LGKTFLRNHATGIASDLFVRIQFPVTTTLDERADYWPSRSA